MHRPIGRTVICSIIIAQKYAKIIGHIFVPVWKNTLLQSIPAPVTPQKK